MNARLFGLLIIALLLGAAGQLLMKDGLSRYQAQHGAIEGSIPPLGALLTLGVMAGLGCFVLSSMLYLGLMAKLELSKLYPMVALNYVFVTILARFFFTESLYPGKLIGLAVIVVGVAVLGFSEPTAGGGGADDEPVIGAPPAPALGSALSPQSPGAMVEDESEARP